MKKRVICDMNVWYNIASGNIKVEEHNNVELIAPGTNIIEFASTENFYSKLNLVKKALQVLHDNGKLIDIDAFDYIVSHYVNVNFEANKEFYSGQIKEFELLLDGKIGDYFEHAENIRAFNEKIRKINAPAQKFADNLTSLLPDIRKEGKKREGTTKKFNDSILNDPNHYLNVIRLIRDIIIQKLDMSEDELKNKINYDGFELFFRGFDSFFIDKVTKKNAKVKINDIYDLTNLAYVGTDELYWTDDKYWIKLLDNNPFTKKYIYNTWNPHISK